MVRTGLRRKTEISDRFVGGIFLICDRVERGNIQRYAGSSLGGLPLARRLSVGNGRYGLGCL